jgi:hypothetical protein
MHNAALRDAYHCSVKAWIAVTRLAVPSGSELALNQRSLTSPQPARATVNNERDN